jgi:hypothetical protein
MRILLDKNHAEMSLCGAIAADKPRRLPCFYMPEATLGTPAHQSGAASKRC